MPRLPHRRLATRRVPWLLVAEAIVTARRHWMDRLTEGERRHLLELLRQSGGRPANLSSRQRDEVRRLVRKLDPAGLGRELVPFVSRARRRR